ncbi:MAG: hypothetical protein ACFB5Z_13755 [Elainellaceae cyanobacterium]
MLENFYGVPYVLVVAGLFAGVTSALAFGATVKQGLETWSRNRDTLRLTDVQNFSLLVPFAAACAGICVFLASTVQIFSFSPKVAYSIAVPLTLIGGAGLWVQFGQLLRQAEKGGAKSLDTNFSIKITQR